MTNVISLMEEVTGRVVSGKRVGSSHEDLQNATDFVYHKLLNKEVKISEMDGNVKN